MWLLSKPFHTVSVLDERDVAGAGNARHAVIMIRPTIEIGPGFSRLLPFGVINHPQTYMHLR